MSALFEDFGDPDRNTRSGFLTWVAHIQPWVLGFYALLFTLSSLIPKQLPPGVTNVERQNIFQPAFFSSLWVGLILNAPLVFVLLVSATHRYLARICLKCMEAVRADAPTRVKRWIWLLWITHKLTGWRLDALLVVGAVINVYGIAWVCDQFQVTQPLWTGLPIIWLLYLSFYGEWKHHRYRPWCPYCPPWDEGGEHEEAPTPAPDPVGTKTGG